MLEIQLLWPVMMEYFHKNGWKPQPYPIEGIGNPTLLVKRLVGSHIGCGAHGQGAIGVKHITCRDHNSLIVLY